MKMFYLQAASSQDWQICSARVPLLQHEQKVHPGSSRCLRLPHLIALDHDSSEDLDDLGQHDDDSEDQEDDGEDLDDHDHRDGDRDDHEDDGEGGEPWN